MDPFDDVQPIGRRESDTAASSPAMRARTTGKSNHERVVESGREGRPDSRTNQARVPRVGSQRGGIGIGTRGGVLTLEQLSRMNSDIAKLSYRDAKTTAKLSDRKHASTSLAIHTDKLLLLSNRPTQAHDFTASEQQREPLRELGLVIANARQPIADSSRTAP